MSAAPLVTIGPDDDLERAGQTMAWTRIRHLPVVEEGRLVGILSERDFLRARVEHEAGPAAGRAVRSAMRAPVTWIGPDDPIESALALMVSHGFGCLPVVSSQGLVGMLTSTDLLRRQLYGAFAHPHEDRPAQPATTPAGRFAVKILPLAGFKFRVQFDREQYPELLTDEPAPLGTDAAPNPARILAAALGTCLAASLRYCLRKEGAPDAQIAAEVGVELVRNEHTRLRIGRVDVTIRPEGAIDARALSACRKAFEDFCVVTQSVRQGIDVRVQVVHEPPPGLLPHDGG